MRLRLLAVALFLAGILCLGQQAQSQLTLTGVGADFGAGGCSATLSIDGTPVSAHLGSDAAMTYTISTSLSNDVIVVIQESHTAINGAPSVSGSTLGPFTQAPSGSFINGTLNQFWIYYKVAPGTLTSEVVTFDASAFVNGSFQSGTIWAINGANTSSPFDSGGPQFTSSTVDQMTTAVANTALIGLTEGGVASFTGGGTGWTVRNNGNFFISQDRIVSATGTYTLDNASSSYSDGNAMTAVKRSC